MTGYGQEQGDGYLPPPPGVYSPLIYSPSQPSLTFPYYQLLSPSTSSEFSQQLPDSSTSSQNNTDQYTIEIQPQPESQIHVAGEVPIRQSRRYKQQDVKLDNGNFICDFTVPEKLINGIKLRDEDEFKKVRYTACTCDPDDFQKEKYVLRQELYKREIEIFIVITMYDEDAKSFARSFYGVVKNIYDLTKQNNSHIWGNDGWKKVVVCVVSDGYEEINETTKAYLAAIGVYQEGVIKKEVNDKPVTAHIFEYTTQFCIDPNMNQVGEEVKHTPIQVLFCLKEENAKKINSHRWFFNAFSNKLDPKVCILLDLYRNL
ncbi:Glycosyltransferase Family 2 protein [Glomus cerebriforme]|uniref:Chitin synthase n=1 Tax=Glomus cerebriforme TaxID=658196 RepID=A0A397SDU7_9GLOM|nr:Glycosyltransferase Family 2 protein [Glomus cerebriforme]